MTKRLRIDWFLFAIAATLAVFGAVMVYSASAMIAMKETQEQSQYTYFYKQAFFTMIGLGLMLVGSRIDYRRYQSDLFVYGLLAVTVGVFIPVHIMKRIDR